MIYKSVQVLMQIWLNGIKSDLFFTDNYQNILHNSLGEYEVRRGIVVSNM